MCDCVIVNRAYRTELDPNNRQQTLLSRSAGTARFAWNWGLQKRIEEYRATGRSSNAIAQHRQLNGYKKAFFPWMYQVSKCCPQEALRDLDRAYKNFFEGRAGFPRFKSKKRGAGSFRLTGAIRVFQERIQLPRLGRIRLREKGYIPTDRHMLSATVSERAGRWFVSVAVEEEMQIPENDGPVAGVDLGITRMATVSDGTVLENPKALNRHERKLKRLQRSVSRRQKGSNNRDKARLRLAKLHLRIANVRRDAVHKATSWLARTKSAIVVEDLNVQGIRKNRHMARSTSDAGMGEFRRQLEYKSLWYGSRLIVAGRFYASTKTCSACGHAQDIALSERTYRCPVCGLEITRDLNAALNLEKVAASSTETINACLRREVHASPTVEAQVPARDAGIEHHLGDVLEG